MFVFSLKSAPTSAFKRNREYSYCLRVGPWGLRESWNGNLVSVDRLMLLSSGAREGRSEESLLELLLLMCCTVTYIMGGGGWEGVGL